MACVSSDGRDTFCAAHFVCAMDCVDNTTAGAGAASMMVGAIDASSGTVFTGAVGDDCAIGGASTGGAA